MDIQSFNQLDWELRNDFIYLREKMSDIKFWISETNAESLIIKCIWKYINTLQELQKQTKNEKKVTLQLPKKFIKEMELAKEEAISQLWQ